MMLEKRLKYNSMFLYCTVHVQYYMIIIIIIFFMFYVFRLVECKSQSRDHGIGSSSTEAWIGAERCCQ